MRLFISLEIPEKIKEEIIKVQKELPNFEGKFTEEENLHLTLKFLGEIDEEKLNIVRKKLREIKFREFNSNLGSIGVFSSKFIRIVWINLTTCEELQSIIDDKLKDLFEKEKRFMSHLTIARIKSIKDKNSFLEKLEKIKFNKEGFLVSKFYLMKSTLCQSGPKYEVIEEYNLN